MLLPSTLGFSPHPPVSVYGTGAAKAIEAFLDGVDSGASLLKISLPITVHHHLTDLPIRLDFPLGPGFPFPGLPILPCPLSSVLQRYRNINLLSIDYDFRPRLRSRLTQSRSALLWKPWIFGLKDSHLHLATHSGILSSYHSTAPFGTASSR